MKHWLACGTANVMTSPPRHLKPARILWNYWHQRKALLKKHLQTRELGDVLEEAIESLPSGFRAVFILRAVEEMSTSEVAECLDLSEENVKVRLHRARALLKEHLTQKLESNARQTFQFHAVRCDRVVANVLKKISALTHSSAQA